MIVNCGGNKIYVDDTLSITSVNAIQNRAVSIAINGIVARIDNIDTAIGNIQQDIGEIQGDVTDLETGTAKLNGDNVFTGNNQFNINPKGANPVSGAVDTSLVTANWISQSGIGKPNNLLHNIGNEKKTGDLEVDGILSSTHPTRNGAKIISQSAADTTEWYKVYEFTHSGTASYGDNAITMLVSYLRRSADYSGSNAIGILTTSYRSNHYPFEWMLAGSELEPSYFKMTSKIDTANNRTTITIWVRVDNIFNRWVFTKMLTTTLNSMTDNWAVSTDNTAYSEPTEDDYNLVITSRIMTIRTSR